MGDRKTDGAIPIRNVSTQFIYKESVQVQDSWSQPDYANQITDYYSATCETFDQPTKDNNEQMKYNKWQVVLLPEPKTPPGPFSHS